MEKSKHIIDLFKKYAANRHTPDELTELLLHFGLDADKGLLMKLIEGELNKLPDENTNRDLIDSIATNVEQKVFSQTMCIPGQSRSAKRLRVLYPYAAAVITLFLIGTGIYWYAAKDRQINEPLISVYGADVLPGGNKATLTLSDGRVIDLDSANKGVLTEQSEIIVTKNGNGAITYTALPGGGQAGIVTYHTIATPKGGQYRVTLPDGSKVWLNAASSLRYPSSFAATAERKVELTGEGYFEVAENEKQPFVVQSKGQSVRVLGTHFNINSYANEPAVSTTLIEGSVSITSVASAKPVLLIPGQQALVSGQQLRIQSVDVNDYTAWKDGFIILSHADLNEVIRQIERWYNVTFTIEAQPASVTLSGVIPRNTRLSEVLQVLELNTGMKFRIEGRRVRILN